MPVGGKPVIQHMLEALVRKGVKKAALVCGEKADYVQGFVGTGRRWGIEADIVLARNFEGVAEAVRLAAPDRHERLIVLPSLTVDGCGAPFPPADWTPEEGPLVLSWQDESEGPHPEILLIDGDHVARLRPGAVTARQAAPDARAVKAQGQAIIVRDLKSYWDANRKLLMGESPFGPLPGRPGIRARVHPGAVVSAPALLGEAVEVGAVCQIGPLAVVGEHSILDDGAEARECVILPGTFVGRNTSVVRAVADQGLLVNIDDGAELYVPDPFILGPASAFSLAGLVWDFAQRGIALAALAAVSPILALFALRRCWDPDAWGKKTVAVSREVVTLSGEKSFSLAQMHFAKSRSPFLSGLPALWDVFKGRLALVGVEPVSPEDAMSLAGGWAEPRFSCRAGLVNPWHAQDEDADEIQRRVMEVFYSQTRSPSSDIRMIWEAAVKFMAGWFRPSGG
jgi:hypothetical protein